jgi:hypothetical protein
MKEAVKPTTLDKYVTKLKKRGIKKEQAEKIVAFMMAVNDFKKINEIKSDYNNEFLKIIDLWLFRSGFSKDLMLWSFIGIALKVCLAFFTNDENNVDKPSNLYTIFLLLLPPILAMYSCYSRFSNKIVTHEKASGPFNLSVKEMWSIVYNQKRIVRGPNKAYSFTLVNWDGIIKNGYPTIYGKEGVVIKAYNKALTQQLNAKDLNNFIKSFLVGNMNRIFKDDMKEMKSDKDKANKEKEINDTINDFNAKNNSWCEIEVENNKIKVTYKAEDAGNGSGLLQEDPSIKLIKDDQDQTKAYQYRMKVKYFYTNLLKVEKPKTLEIYRKFRDNEDKRHETKIDNLIKLKQKIITEVNQAIKKEEAKEIKQQQDTTIKLQKIYRGYNARKQVAIKKEKRMVAIKLQKVTRGYLTKVKYKKIRSSALQIQKQAHKYISRKKTQQKIDSSITLQKNFRGFNERINFKKTKDSAIVTQKLLRGKNARKTYRVTKSKKLNAVKIIQKIILKKIKNKKNAATKIQKNVRGHLALKKYLAKKQAVIALQSNVRGNIARTKLKKINAKNLPAAIKIQKTTRRYLAVSKVQRIRKAILTIQKNIRGHLARKRVNIQIAAKEVRRKEAKIKTVKHSSIKQQPPSHQTKKKKAKKTQKKKTKETKAKNKIQRTATQHEINQPEPKPPQKIASDAVKRKAHNISFNDKMINGNFTTPCQVDIKTVKNIALFCRKNNFKLYIHGPNAIPDNTEYLYNNLNLVIIASNIEVTANALKKSLKNASPTYKTDKRTYHQLIFQSNGNIPIDVIFKQSIEELFNERPINITRVMRELKLNDKGQELIYGQLLMKESDQDDILEGTLTVKPELKINFHNIAFHIKTLMQSKICRDEEYIKELLTTVQPFFKQQGEMLDNLFNSWGVHCDHCINTLRDYSNQLNHPLKRELLQAEQKIYSQHVLYPSAQQLMPPNYTFWQQEFPPSPHFDQPQMQQKFPPNPPFVQPQMQQQFPMQPHHSPVLGYLDPQMPIFWQQQQQQQAKIQQMQFEKEKMQAEIQTMEA